MQTETLRNELTTCQNCGTTNESSNDWCRKCGWSLKLANNTANIRTKDPDNTALDIQGASFIGKRKNNEDAYVITKTELYHDNEAKTVHLLAVSDGMGGYECGEEASRTTVTTISKISTKDPFFLKSSIKFANSKIYIDALKKHSESGATIISALIINDNVHVFWAGDSPLYHIRNGEVIYRTEDHNIANELISQGMRAEEANTHPEKSLITKSLGADENIELSEKKLQAKPGDVLVLCSDGISGVLIDEEICRIILENSNARDACNCLLRKALDNGSSDNLTAIVAKF